MAKKKEFETEEVETDFGFPTRDEEPAPRSFDEGALSRAKEAVRKAYSVSSHLQVNKLLERAMKELDEV